MTMLRYPFLDLGTLTAPLLPALEQAALRVLRSGRFIGGPEVETLQQRLCTLTGCTHALAVSSGFDALRLILRAYVLSGRLAHGDKVVVPANTFAATSLAVADAGLIPVFVEPDAATGLIDFDALDTNSAVNDCRAVMAVDLYGRACPGFELSKLADQRKWIVVEDAAQAIGAVSATAGVSDSRHAGALGHAGAFSFYPTKNAGALGDAGAVMTNDDNLAEMIHALANYGSPERYRHDLKGANCRMDPLQAAMLTVKLDALETENAARVRNASLYDRYISHPLVTLPPLAGDTVWHQYVVRVADGQRDSFRQYLYANGIGTDIHYPVPCHLQQCHQDVVSYRLPVAERLAAEIVSLPISSATSAEDIAAISEIINNYK